MTGRPRNPAADEAIIRSTLTLAEQLGYRGVSIEAIAAHSGVAKQTIYRRYPSLGEVMLAALASFADQHLPHPDTGSLRDDLYQLLSATFAAQQQVSGELNRGLAAAAIQDATFATRLWERLIESRREVVRTMIGRARERGEVTHPDDDFLVDLVFGPMWYRLLFGREALDDGYARRLAEAVVAAA
ncbi:TetR family transcriptional regulator [Actinoplanes ianthinogenes]|uniref:TetR family transcriptional regulator n=1 Tax=Actinoplanes ianthinogenes TaxID=122358 RepID=A0ABM7M866_9ACTN|nr:TetR/AcrR family transcriptional regulator [Actinoplanes ianthinogenes]BCJ47839.1 TetR family transcriptional regulator [Actinoplanes ianthinogenes]GGR04521.1 TetR family transcriptional regulator [Actinoplanes ianthinogenes]